MGYHRPVSSFKYGQKGEFAERVYFREEGASQKATCPDCALEAA